VCGQIAMFVEVSVLPALVVLAAVLRLRDGSVVGQKTVRAYIEVAFAVAAVVAAADGVDSKQE
jgi:hypothetical protein